MKRILSKIIEAVKKVKGWYFSPNVQYPKEIDKLVDEEIVDKFAVAGTPDECIAKLRSIIARYRFSSLSLNLSAVRREKIFDGMLETVNVSSRYYSSFEKSLNVSKRDSSFTELYEATFDRNDI